MRATLWCLLALSLAALPACDRGEEQSKRHFEDRQRAIEATVSRLAAKHGARAHWERALGETDPLFAYSFEVQRALVGDGRPVVILALPIDVSFVTEGVYQLDARATEFVARELLLRLRCSPSAMEGILSHRPNRWDTIAVAARIEGVRSPLLEPRLQSPPALEEGDPAAEFPDVVLTDSEALIAHGECLEGVVLER